MSLSTLEAYDLVRFAEAIDSRLAAADELLAGRPGLEREKEWLATAIQIVRTERAPAPALLEKVRDLPEPRGGPRGVRLHPPEPLGRLPREAPRRHHLLRQQPCPRHRGPLPPPQVPPAPPRLP
ncbi:hypothetical protein ACN28I_11495 [Archangium gephyra]|uniref:hypothetical protein n=1 Tax=Archangium gephyra TaxID=48 RepID=UPI003B7E5A71